MKTLVFSVADKQYGVNILQVREVVRMRQVTPVPDVAAFIEGVISLRGKVIPLINLRKKLGFPAQADASNRIVVTRVQANWVGVVVDKVKDVVTFQPEEITQPDDMLKSARYLKGVVNLDSNLVLIVDIAGMLMDDEQASLQKVQERVEVKKK